MGSRPYASMIRARVATPAGMSARTRSARSRAEEVDRDAGAVAAAGVCVSAAAAVAGSAPAAGSTFETLCVATSANVSATTKR